MHYFYNFLVSLLLELVLLFPLLFNLVLSFGVIPLILLQIHLSRVIITIKQLLGQLKAHIVLPLLLLLPLVLLLCLFPLLFIQNPSKFFIHFGILILLLLLDFFIDNIPSFLLPGQHLLGLCLLCLPLLLDLTIVALLELSFLRYLRGCR